MSQLDFEYTSLPNKVYFGRGKKAVLPDVLRPFQKTFVIASLRARKQLSELEQHRGADSLFHFPEVIQHVPEYLVEKALAAFHKAQSDVLVAIGGGSAIGLAKALALETGTPIVALPTTYSGSEMTNIWGKTTPQGKRTGRDARVLPRCVIYDPELTAGMPVALAATSAMNAMAHLMEAVYAFDSNPITYHNSLLGMDRLRLGMQHLGREKALSPEANEFLLFGAFLAGKGLCEVSMALHHKAAHVLGGSFGMEHSGVHTVLQAYVLEYQWEALSDTIREDLKKALDHSYPPQALMELAAGMGAPTTLKEIGFKKEDIPQAVELMLANPYPNPKPLAREGLEEMLERAYSGRVPKE